MKNCKAFRALLESLVDVLTNDQKLIRQPGWVPNNSARNVKIPKNLSSYSILLEHDLAKKQEACRRQNDHTCLDSTHDSRIVKNEVTGIKL